MKKILIIFIGCFCVLTAFSQTVTEVRQMRLNAMEVFDNYIATLKNLDVPDSRVKDEFLKLFDTDAVVYNDILPDNEQQVITPESYYEKYVQLIKSYPFFWDLELGIPYKENGKWYVKVNFIKSFIITYKQYDLSYPEYAFDCEMLVEMTQNENYVKKENYSKRDINTKVNQPFINAKIKNLSVTEPLQDYLIIQLNDSKLSNKIKGLYYNGMKVDFSAEENIKLFDSKEYNIDYFTLNPELNVDDYKISVRQYFDERYFQYNISPLKNMIGVQLLGFMNFNIKPDDNFNELKFSSYGTGISILYSRLIAHSKGGINWYINLKPGYSVDFLTIKGDTLNGNYNEPDAEVKVNLLKIKERDIFHSIELPFGIGLSKSIKSVSLIGDLGFWIKYTFAQQHTLGIDTVNSKLYSHNCIGNINEHTELQIFNPTKYNPSKQYSNFDLGFYAAVGVMFKLKDFWYLKTSVEYRYGFRDHAKVTYNENLITTFKKEEYEPFFQSINKWQENRFQINIGIIRKL